MSILQDILTFEHIVIQCHDSPDADALACALALHTFLQEQGKPARIIYSGRAKITKPNLIRMVDVLEIPAEYVVELPPADVLVLVDCQYGESNVTRFEAARVLQIDHHADKSNGRGGIVRSSLASCSTLVWDMLVREGFPLNAHPRVATALYYGLYTDSNGFEEIAHPLDKDLRDNLPYNQVVFNSLRFNNLSIDELGIAGRALTKCRIDRDNKFAIFRADECDQNILGFISDLALQVDGVDVCVVYSRLQSGCKLSIRSCTREVMASDIAGFIAGGGGHRQKAGGFIAADKLGDTPVSEYISNLCRSYFSSYDTVYAETHNLGSAAMPVYVKRRIPLGAVTSTDIFEAGTPMLIRTLEGDSDVVASADILLMIGIEGEVYPIRADKFRRNYIDTDQGFVKDFTYSPVARNKITGESVMLVSHAVPCIPTGRVHIRAAPISKDTKVFNSWNPEGYMLGTPGDYIAMRTDDERDVYIIKKDIFLMTYDPA
ncbi:MAG: DHH family phosphoesterase [Defluviitaleaceae bacterium]|nr:DHH family phosphoesterase [Defluviitaleaceae bacterium]